MSLKAWFRYGYVVGRDGRAQVETVMTIVILGIIIALGILVYSEVQTTVFPDIGNSAANTRLENTASNATSDYGTAMELAPVILIVLIAAVVLGIVSRFR